MNKFSMIFKREVKSPFVSWNYDKLSIITTYGRGIVPLNVIINKTEMLDVDFSCILHNKLSDFVSGFCLDGYSGGLAINRDRERRNGAIIIYGLHNDQTKRFMDQIIDLCKCKVETPNDLTVNIVENKVCNFELKTYLCSQNLALESQKEFESVYKARRYAEFLTNMKRTEFSKSIDIAFRKFGLADLINYNVC